MAVGREENQQHKLLKSVLNDNHNKVPITVERILMNVYSMRNNENKTDII